jgi:hypothetical protein
MNELPQQSKAASEGLSAIEFLIGASRVSGMAATVYWLSLIARCFTVLIPGFAAAGIGCLAYSLYKVFKDEDYRFTPLAVCILVGMVASHYDLTGIVNQQSAVATEQRQ